VEILESIVTPAASRRRLGIEESLHWKTRTRNDIVFVIQTLQEAQLIRDKQSLAVI